MPQKAEHEGLMTVGAIVNAMLRYQHHVPRASGSRRRENVFHFYQISGEFKILATMR